MRLNQGCGLDYMDMDMELVAASGTGKGYGRAASGADTGLAARLARAVPPRGTKTSLGRWSPASTSGPNMKASVALCSGW